MKLLFLLIFYPLDLTRDPVAYSTPSFWYGPWSTEPAEGPTLEERERGGYVGKWANRGAGHGAGALGRAMLMLLISWGHPS